MSPDGMDRIAAALERIASSMAPSTDSPEAAAERERITAAFLEEATGWRYRKIVYDGMDTIRTTVVPLASVERALYRATNGGRWGQIRLDARPADTEGPREDEPR